MGHRKLNTWNSPIIRFITDRRSCEVIYKLITLVSVSSCLWQNTRSHPSRLEWTLTEVTSLHSPRKFVMNIKIVWIHKHNVCSEGDEKKNHWTNSCVFIEQLNSYMNPENGPQNMSLLYNYTIAVVKCTFFNLILSINFYSERYQFPGMFLIRIEEIKDFLHFWWTYSHLITFISFQSG